MAKIAQNQLYALPLDIEPMEAKLVDRLPREEGWQFEPKWDGFRCVAFKSGSAVDLRAKSGKPLGRYFPEMLSLLSDLPVNQFVVDGELVIESEGRLSFETLQMRLHPAESRIRKLAGTHPAKLVLFDVLADSQGRSQLNQPLEGRRTILEAMIGPFQSQKEFVLSPYTKDGELAEVWLSKSGSDGFDGVVCKRLDGPYAAGERAMIKVKRFRTADCVVGGFRYESRSDKVGSLLLGLYNEEGKLDHVGFTSSISDSERVALTKQLEALRQPPGFTGKKPGGPSRWSTERSGEWEPLKSKLVVEVRFDHVTGRRFRHGTTLLRWRPDKKPRQCGYEQIDQAIMADPTY
ncbi:ATP-dependent DNA ligase [Rhizobium grahamii]|uniref:DNA ligase (ATP) n=1 Tax=Rhizobium grahamii TaxID=1120045 RepID=A0A370KFT0_9HYPH|nr:ATP-dependent DNA ligase [Rhizobium grahamii]RDJ03306.1 ATP-dependent DNA ligase [Rhizobium grahamii]